MLTWFSHHTLSRLWQFFSSAYWCTLNTVEILKHVKCCFVVHRLSYTKQSTCLLSPLLLLVNSHAKVHNVFHKSKTAYIYIYIYTCTGMYVHIYTTANTASYVQHCISHTGRVQFSEECLSTKWTPILLHVKCLQLNIWPPKWKSSVTSCNLDAGVRAITIIHHY